MRALLLHTPMGRPQNAQGSGCAAHCKEPSQTGHCHLSGSHSLSGQQLRTIEAARLQISVAMAALKRLYVLQESEQPLRRAMRAASVRRMAIDSRWGRPKRSEHQRLILYVLATQRVAMRGVEIPWCKRLTRLDATTRTQPDMLALAARTLPLQGRWPRLAVNSTCG